MCPPILPSLCRIFFQLAKLPHFFFTGILLLHPEPCHLCVQSLLFLSELFLCLEPGGCRLFICIEKERALTFPGGFGQPGTELVQIFFIFCYP